MFTINILNFDVCYNMFIVFIINLCISSIFDCFPPEKNYIMTYGIHMVYQITSTPWYDVYNESLPPLDLRSHCHLSQRISDIFLTEEKSIFITKVTLFFVFLIFSVEK